METGEVTRTQEVAGEAEEALEEAANKVRLLSADLQAAQEAAAQAAMRAHTAQLQLSAHDQLMFTARQRVDALSAQVRQETSSTDLVQIALIKQICSICRGGDYQGQPNDSAIAPYNSHKHTHASELHKHFS